MVSGQPGALPRLYERDEVPARRFSGEIKRDFHAITKRGRAPGDRLALILKHSGYECSGVEHQAALAIIERAEPNNTGNVYTILAQLDMGGLRDLARTARRAFTFEDKHTKQWRSIYCVVAQDASVVAEVGTTCRSHDELIVHLRHSRVRGHDTKLGRFLASVSTAHLLPLESHFGDLDQADIVKYRWRRAGVLAGVRFPECPAQFDLKRVSPQQRTWPDFEWVAAAGTRLT